MNEIESNRNLGCAVVSAGEKKVTWRARDGIARADSVAAFRHSLCFFSLSTILWRGNRQKKRKQKKGFVSTKLQSREE